MIENEIKKIAGVIATKTKIAVLPHNSADGDTLGSSVAFCLAMRGLGKNAQIVYEEKIPGHLSDLIAHEELFVFLPDDQDVFYKGWDAVAVFDTADTKLLGKRAKFLELTGCVLNVDHHVTNQGYGDYKLIDAEASSTAEIAYNLILALGAKLDHDIALAIYTGVCTDTGGFSYSNTTRASHEIAAQTLQFGIDVAYLRYKFFDSITLAKLRCHAFVANSLKLYNDGRVAVVVVSASALADLGAVEEDCEGLVNIGRNIEGVELSAFAREARPGEFRVNLRSRGKTDVAEIARKFDGGGHRLAAGCTIKAAPSEVESLLTSAIQDYYQIDL